ncbi:MAG: hypothetical protein COU29_02245 [Candidatus Magasanikbacteria bacterium CG10_big_fil_rev_8_21_14_0_10_36_32]|uniref:DUF916 domain-containing protein n=1 Tax=Candidatus Magasanikbacteria bacterium CG10_big_fil_rev_8_21_14_0_10_36_32 TaxID=1974646 RepID=A0A2M6W711_9BACT|nr:MAG: hypothetical protein COU29_02245 [Candidatus Magasanikbacteria bacterium CG10_big_fil_rev_8_21_14_0_10_36_32]
MFKKFLFVLLICFLWVGKAEAFSISPLKYVVTVSPRSSEEVEIKIKNDQLVSQRYVLKVLGTKQNNQGELIFSEGVNQAENWVKPEKNVVQIDPGEEVTVNFFIKTDSLAESGSYFLGLAAENVDLGEREVGLSGELVCLLLLQVSGQVQENLSVTNWQTENITINKIWNFDLSIKNTSAVELPIQSELIIRNWRNKIIYRELNDLGLLLPQADRIFQQKIDMVGQTFFSGSYSATLNIIYGRTNQIKTLVKNFWRISPVWIIILSVVAVGIITLLYRIKKRMVVKLKKYIENFQA